MGKAAASASAPVSFLRIEHLLSSGRGFEVGIAPWFPYLDHMAVQVSLTTSRLTELKSRIEFTFCYGLSLRSSVAFHTTSRPCSYVELRGEVIPGWILTIWLCTLSGTLMRPSRAHPTAPAMAPRLVPPDKLRPGGTQHSPFSTASRGTQHSAVSTAPLAGVQKLHLHRLELLTRLGARHGLVVAIHAQRLMVGDEPALTVV